MKNKLGFTLIEMLVVVLIIGILAGVALPQYTKTVKKAKLAQVDILVDTAKKNIQIYLDANGYPVDNSVYFTGTESVGDIGMPGDCSEGVVCRTDIGEFYAYCESGSCFIEIDLGTGKFELLKDPTLFDEWLVYNVKSGTDNTEDIKILCQWLKDRHYATSSNAGFPAYDECLNINIPLDDIDD